MTKLQEQAFEIIQGIPEDKVMLAIEILRVFQTQQNKGSKNTPSKTASPNSIKGALKKYANPELISLEKQAWAEAVGEKHVAY